MFLVLYTVPVVRTWTLLLVFIVLCGPVWAQESRQVIGTPSDWANVTTLAAGTELRVELRSGELATGSLVSATDDGVTLSSEHRDTFFSRGMILRIVLRGHRLTARYAKRGFIIGAVAGGLMGTLGTKSNRLPWGAFLAGAWGAVGAASGAIDGHSQREESVVYGAQVDSR